MAEEITLIEISSSAEIVAFQLITPEAQGIDMRGPTGPQGLPGDITPLVTTPTTLNEVIAAGSTLGLWP
jgi:hypothetical protein